MSNKPSIYGFCPAGCKWETVHKEDFEQAATYNLVEIDNNTAEMVAPNIYKIFRANGSTSWGFQIKMRFIVGGLIYPKTITLPTFDTYTDYVLFRPLSAIGNGYDVDYTYELNGVRATETITWLDNMDDGDMINSIVVGANKVLKFNSDADIVLEPYKVFIKYADDDGGTNMTDTWSAGKNFIGQYVGKAASTIPSDYKWAEFSGCGNTYINISSFESLDAVEQENISNLVNSLKDSDGIIDRFKLGNIVLRKQNANLGFDYWYLTQLEESEPNVEYIFYFTKINSTGVEFIEIFTEDGTTWLIDKRSDSSYVLNETLIIGG